MKCLKSMFVSTLVILTLSFSIVVFGNLVFNTDKASAWLTTDEVDLCILLNKNIKTGVIDAIPFWMCLDYMDAD